MKISRTFFAQLIFLLAFQILVFNNLNLDHRIIVKIYYLPLLFLPLNIEKSRLYVFAFFLALGLDFLEGSYGLNTFSILILLAIRNRFCDFFLDSGERKEINYLTDKTLGLFNFILFLGISTFTFHSIYFLLESFYVMSIQDMLISVLFSSSLSLLINLLLALIFLDGLTSNE